MARAFALRAAVVGGLVALAVGLRAGSPLDASRTPWDLADLRTAGGVLLVLASVAGAVLLVLGLVFRYRDGGLPPRRRSLRQQAAVLLGGLLLLGAVVHVLPRLRAPRPPELGAEVSVPDVVVEEGATGAPTSLLLAAGLALLAVVLTTLVARSRPRLGDVPPQEAPEEPGTELSRAVTEGLTAATRALREHRDEAPRERVVEAYAAFEQTLAERGVDRGLSGTPMRLLAAAVRSGAPPEPAGELTELFGIARFGQVPVTEEDVARAQSALDELLAPR